MLAFLIFAAEGAVDHGNKTPFYVTGLVLAGFALLVGGIGVDRARRHRRARRRDARGVHRHLRLTLPARPPAPVRRARSGKTGGTRMRAKGDS
jgi:hypothetical protein